MKKNEEQLVHEEEIAIDESMKTRITLAALIGFLSIPKLLPADELTSAMAGKQPTVQNVTAAIDKSSSIKDKLYSGYTAINAANIVARTLFHEARGEGTSGIDAVASVILNRAGGKAENLPAVCLAKKQFSCWNDLKDLTPDKYKMVVPDSITKNPKENELWAYCKKTAGKMIFGEFKSTIGDKNCYYAHKKVTPDWASKMTKTEKIGNHTFGYLAYHDGSIPKKTPSKKTNKKTVAKAKQTAVPSGKTYEIKAKDTLSAIALQHKTSVSKLLELNPKINPRRLKIGSKINLPS